MNDALTFTLYHGSPFEFDSFNRCKSGIHFGTYDQAAHAATIKLGQMPVEEFAKLQEINGWRGRIYECRIRATNPKRIDDPRTPQAWSKQIKQAIDEGYDAIVYDNGYEGSKPASSLCIFDPCQVVQMALVHDEPKPTNQPLTPAQSV